MSNELPSNILSRLETICYHEGWLIGEYQGEERMEVYYHGCKFVVVPTFCGKYIFKIFCEYQRGVDVTYSQISRTYLGEDYGWGSSVNAFASMLFSDMVHEAHIIRRVVD